MPRSLRVDSKYIERVRLSLRRNGFPSQRALAEELGLALDTVGKFLRGKPVDRAIFEEICDRLSLDSQEIATFGDEPATGSLPSEANSLEQSSLSYQDWGEAPEVSTFYGRTAELATLHQWMTQDRCRLVAILGMGGMGKTTLAARLAHQVQDQFEYVIWRSLRYEPSALAIIAEMTAFLAQSSDLSSHSPTVLTSTTFLTPTLDQQISQLLALLRQHRCLLVFDDWESVFQEGELAGYCTKAHEGYSRLLQRVIQERHQSCVLLLSREQPIEMSVLVEYERPINVFKLKGLKPNEAESLLISKGFTSNQPGLMELIQLHRGNPASLQIAAATIQDLFNGDIAYFLAQSSLVVGDILINYLDQQFARLSDLEMSVMYCLAISKQAIALSELIRDISMVSRSELFSALESLRRRHLIETVNSQNANQSSSLSGETWFALEPVVMKYVIQQLIVHICHDLEMAIRAGTVENLGLLGRYELVRGAAYSAIEPSMYSFILKRIGDRLKSDLNRTSQQIEAALKDLLFQLQAQPLESNLIAETNLVLLLNSL